MVRGMRVLRPFGNAARYGLGLAIQIDVPTRPGDIARRYHNKYLREALAEEFDTHHRRRIPRHYRQDAHGRYQYAERDDKYKSRKDKVFKSRRDLVKTGASEKEMKTNRRIVIGGAAEGGKKPIEGALFVRFAFKGGSARFKRGGDKPQRIPIRQMMSEVRRFTADERREFAQGVMDRYWQKVSNHRSNRKRVRISI